MANMSPSSRGRGLKSLFLDRRTDFRKVALFTRAWIEMLSFVTLHCGAGVALFTRAWIEIIGETVKIKNTPGRPLHEGVD